MNRTGNRRGQGRVQQALMAHSDWSMTDAAISRRLTCTPDAVHRYRLAQGIPSTRGWRRRQVIALLCCGYTDGEIGEQLNVKKPYVALTRRKLGVPAVTRFPAMTCEVCGRTSYKANRRVRWCSGPCSFYKRNVPPSIRDVMSPRATHFRQLIANECARKGR